MSSPQSASEGEFQTPGEGSPSSISSGDLQTVLKSVQAKHGSWSESEDEIEDCGAEKTLPVARILTLDGEEEGRWPSLAVTPSVPVVVSLLEDSEDEENEDDWTISVPRTATRR